MTIEEEIGFGALAELCGSLSKVKSGLYILNTSTIVNISELARTVRNNGSGQRLRTACCPNSYPNSYPNDYQ
jgi:hypothetical protein